VDKASKGRKALAMVVTAEMVGAAVMAVTHRASRWLSTMH
jgi:hypothetical protein